MVWLSAPHSGGCLAWRLARLSRAEYVAHDGMREPYHDGRNNATMKWYSYDDRECDWTRACKYNLQTSSLFRATREVATTAVP
jgi:hypothetical protein